MKPILHDIVYKHKNGPQYMIIGSDYYWENVSPYDIYWQRVMEAIFDSR